MIVLMAIEGYGPGGQVVMPLRIPVFYAHYAFTPAIPERDAPTLEPTREPLVDHIVVILDESVMGSHLELNGYPRPTTPRLRELAARAEAKTLGVCSSAANYSVGSLLAMLSGTKAESLVDDYDRVLTRPSMIAYGARAGYRALLLNSQDYLPWIAHERNTLGDRLDAKSVDRNRAPAWEWDDSMIEHAVTFVASNPRTLNFIAKRGLHTPYHDKSPPDRRPFAPYLESAAWSDDLIENINTYDNGILWSVDGYLARLHEGLAKTGRSVLVIYTSDQ
ncbi:MAG: sulfatase-like hydrolase/transferase, partial [Phycisphaeraceae bacterium]|nr:sulfatase-like hydrolase/transferase [Phycisphaeraceae bacterium]